MEKTKFDLRFSKSKSNFSILQFLIYSKLQIKKCPSVTQAANQADSLPSDHPAYQLVTTRFARTHQMPAAYSLSGCAINHIF